MIDNYVPSVNILRDDVRELDYVITPNASKVAGHIQDYFLKGFRAINIIGSYGTGKSSFLWAFEKSLSGDKSYFDIGFAKNKKIELIKLVGQYRSIRTSLIEHLKTPADVSDSDLLIELELAIGNSELTILLVDEFGKYLEWAVTNDVHSEIYFLQQLAELFHNSGLNCLLITTLHQNFETYGYGQLSTTEINEWKKVKGRFKQLTFNEPIEQLLSLASEQISNGSNSSDHSIAINALAIKHHIIKSDDDFLNEVSNKLWPLDMISAYVLCSSLQKYGQNERSLFTFLKAELESYSKNDHFGLPQVFDYLFHEFYGLLNSKYNLDYTSWSTIYQALDKIDTEVDKGRSIHEDIIKVVGLLRLFGNTAANVDETFLVNYFKLRHGSKSILEAIRSLESLRLIRYNRFNKSYKLTDITDVNIEDELLKVANEVEVELDVIHKLKNHFNFPIIQARSVSFKRGTPRFFRFEVSSAPITSLPDDYQIDGIINLVFGPSDTAKKLTEASRGQNEILYASYEKLEDIRNTVFEIEKTQRVLKNNADDKVAKKELQSIVNSLETLLNHQVLNSLFSKDVKWFYNGKTEKITSRKHLNRKLSTICEEVYSDCPVFKNELINRHFVSGNIANSRKILFEKLTTEYHTENLGFPDTHFPAEKTIYLTLLKETGIHRKSKNFYELGQPSDERFLALWQKCEEFLNSTSKERKSIADFQDYLSQKPFKLTIGLMEFWIPIFLFIRKDEFALFSTKDGYIPELNGSILYLFTRNPNEYEIKSFNVQGIRLELFNKYRELLQLTGIKKVNNQSLIESIKPFLIFYKELSLYAQNTKKLSKGAIRIRQTIKSTQDPEKLFFEEFPKALSFNLDDIVKSENDLKDYVDQLRASIKEIRSCLQNLIDRIEYFLVNDILIVEDLDFESYREKILSRYSKLKEHMLLPNQVRLLTRLRSPIDHRDSWLNSISQALLGKSLESLEDKEEEILKEKLQLAFIELDNLVSMTESSDSNEGEDVVNIQLTTFEKGTQNKNIIMPKNPSKKAKKRLDEISKSFGTDKELDAFVIMNLLKKHLNE